MAWQRTFLAGALLGLAGCTSLPAGRDDLLAFLADGATLRTEVHEHLGGPSRSFEESRLESYRVGRSPAGWFVLPRREGWNDARYSLVLEFDAQGVLKRHALIEVRP